MKTEFKAREQYLRSIDAHLTFHLVLQSSRDSLLQRKPSIHTRRSQFTLTCGNKSYTLPFAHRKNICRLALNPQGNLLLTIDDDGQAILTNFSRRVVLYHFSLKRPASALAFSPSGRHFAVGLDHQVEVWHTPATPGSSTDGGGIEFAPFVRHRVYTGHFDTIQSIEWSSDGRFFLTSSKDLTARIFSLDPEPDFVPTTLAGHREAVVGAWFSKDQETVKKPPRSVIWLADKGLQIFTVGRDGTLFQWAYVRKPGTENDQEMNQDGGEVDMRWRIIQRHYFNQTNARVTCAAFHAMSNLLVVGFSTGIFGLYEMPDFNQIHTLSISQNVIEFVTINKSGEWLAFGSSKLGQLLVWEWQSETYVLKQQGHFDAMNALAYSPDGQRIITAADDGKVKVWDVSSGFCIATFTEHSSGVTACEFAKRGNVLFTASLDGSIRAWDLIRYRNFRTFTAPTRLSFSCLAVDSSGEVVCAGSLDSFDIHIWSVQNGQLLDRLSGHEGPISSLSFSPTGGAIISGSWDHTVRIWSVFERTQTSEPLQLQADVLCVAFRPDSKQLAVSTLDGQLTFWSTTEANQVGGLDGRRDVSGGRKLTDRRSAANVAGTKSFNTITYSGDGSCVLAGGNSKYICLYDVQSGTLLKKYTVSINLSLEGTQEYLNSRSLTEAGPLGLLDAAQDDTLDPKGRSSLPGARRGDLSARRTRPEVRVSAVAFAPTGQAFCAASTEGLLIYALDQTVAFDPFDLDVDVTPASTLAALTEQHDYTRALVMAFRLNMPGLIRRVYEGVPARSIPLVAKDLPVVYVGKMLRFVAEMTEQTPHLEFNLRWIEAVLSVHGRWIRLHRPELEEELRVGARAVGRIRDDLARLADANVYMLDYLLSEPAAAAVQEVKGGGPGDGVKALAEKVFAHGTTTDLVMLDDDGGGGDADVDINDDAMEEEEEWMGISD
ncbi:MAG: hypothetical protein M1816_003180 [Peltula sp. TS41687]|nr:MAG: hypothetical protein M1816_003180 [Peltula sp. TS41687]